MIDALYGYSTAFSKSFSVTFLCSDDKKKIWKTHRIRDHSKVSIRPDVSYCELRQVYFLISFAHFLIFLCQQYTITHSKNCNVRAIVHIKYKNGAWENSNTLQLQYNANERIASASKEVKRSYRTEWITKKKGKRNARQKNTNTARRQQKYWTEGTKYKYLCILSLKSNAFSPTTVFYDFGTYGYICI